MLKAAALHEATLYLATPTGAPIHVAVPQQSPFVASRLGGISIVPLFSCQLQTAHTLRTEIDLSCSRPVRRQSRHLRAEKNPSFPFSTPPSARSGLPLTLPDLSVNSLEAIVPQAHTQHRRYPCLADTACQPLRRHLQPSPRRSLSPLVPASPLPGTQCDCVPTSGLRSCRPDHASQWSRRAARMSSAGSQKHNPRSDAV